MLPWPLPSRTAYSLGLSFLFAVSPDTPLHSQVSPLRARRRQRWPSQSRGASPPSVPSAVDKFQLTVLRIHFSIGFCLQSACLQLFLFGVGRAVALTSGGHSIHFSPWSLLSAFSPGLQAGPSAIIKLIIPPFCIIPDLTSHP